METVVVIVIIAAATAYTGWALCRKSRVGKKSCRGAEDCPISERCSPEDNRCVAPVEKQKNSIGFTPTGEPPKG